MTKRADPFSYGQLDLFVSEKNHEITLPETDFVSVFLDGNLALLQTYAKLFYGKQVVVVCTGRNERIEVVVTDTRKGVVRELSIVKNNSSLNLSERFPVYPY